MVKQKQQIIYGIMIVIAVFILFYSQIGEKEKDTIKITYYDENKKMITQQTIPEFSVVSNIPGVTYVTFTVNLENTGDVSLDVQITNTQEGIPGFSVQHSPELEQAVTWGQGLPYPSTPINIIVGKTETFGESDFLDIRSYEGKTVRFYIEVTADYLMDGIPQQLTKEDYVELVVKEDLSGAYTLLVFTSGDAQVGACAGVDCTCPDTAEITDGHCCYETTEYNNGYCDLGTSFCAYEVTEDSSSCGGPSSCIEDCTIDFCTACGWVSKESGVCDEGLAECIYIEQPDSSSCGGGGHIVKFRTNSQPGSYVDGTWIAVDNIAGGDLEGYGYSNTVTKKQFEKHCVDFPQIATALDGLPVRRLDDSIVTVCDDGASRGYRHLSGDGDASLAVTSLLPTQPYAEGCQEVYI